MPGRGDNNKTGSAGQGAANQSNQGQRGADAGKSHHDKHTTGGKPSEPQPRTADPDAHRDRHLASEEELAKDKEMD